MGNAFYPRAQSAPDTNYDTYRIVHGMRNASDNSANTIDADTGQSPSMRVMAFAFSWEDVDATTHEVLCRVPRGTLVKDAWVRVDVAFAGGTSDGVLIGATEDLDGLNAAADLTSTAGTYLRDIDAADILSQDLAFPDGGTIVIDFGAAEPTVGQGILFLSVPSYHEPLGAEWL